jgi:uncharacterized lipoprotein YajG
VIRHTVPALTLAATLLVAGCGGDDPETTSPSSTPPPSSTSAAATTPSETAFAGTEIEVAVKGGKVQPPTHRVKVAKGTEVRLLVTSDKADELHVHGYEIEEELPAGEQVTVDFTADQTGVFEIETHETELQLAQLEVR